MGAYELKRHDLGASKLASTDTFKGKRVRARARKSWDTYELTFTGALGLGCVQSRTRADAQASLAAAPTRSRGVPPQPAAEERGGGG